MFYTNNFALNRLFVMLRRFPIESRGRQKKLYEVGLVMRSFMDYAWKT